MNFLKAREEIIQRGNIPLLLPWVESIAVGVADGDGVTTNLVSGFNYVHYASPVREWIQLCGFSINFTPVQVVCSLSNEIERHSWVPFFHTDVLSVAGLFTQACPVLPFIKPIDIPPFSRIQIVLMNLDSVDLEDTMFSLVGVRLREEPCSS